MSPQQRQRKRLLYWKRMTNAWSLVALLVFTIEYFSQGQLTTAASFINILFPAVLTIYAGQKEIARWREKKYESHFSGELSVSFWTGLFIFFVFMSVVSGGYYKLSLELTTTYLAVLSIYAISLQSKEMRSQK